MEVKFCFLLMFFLFLSCQASNDELVNLQEVLIEELGMIAELDCSADPNCDDN